MSKDKGKGEDGDKGKAKDEGDHKKFISEGGAGVVIRGKDGKPVKIPTKNASSAQVASRFLAAAVARRVADSFLKSVDGKKFTNPDTGNKVKFTSLPAPEQAKLRKDQKDEPEDLSDDAELDDDVEDLSDLAEDDDGHHKDPPKKPWKETFKGLGAKAKAFMSDAPKAVKQFVEDPASRKKSLASASAALKKAPAKYVKNLVATAKHEVKEFKEAGAGVAAVLKGGKMDDHQKKAFKAVATHVAIGVAAAALTATGGPLAVAGAFGKGLAKNIALKAVTSGLGKLHMLEEMGHIGHGIQHALHLGAEDKGDDKKPSVDDVIGVFVATMVADQLGDVTDADLEDGLKSLDAADEG